MPSSSSQFSKFQQTSTAKSFMFSHFISSHLLYNQRIIEKMFNVNDLNGLALSIKKQLYLESTSKQKWVLKLYCNFYLYKWYSNISNYGSSFSILKVSLSLNLLNLLKLFKLNILIILESFVTPNAGISYVIYIKNSVYIVYLYKNLFHFFI